MKTNSIGRRYAGRKRERRGRGCLRLALGRVDVDDKIAEKVERAEDALFEPSRTSKILSRRPFVSKEEA